MTARFSIDSEGGQEIERRLGRLVGAFENLEPLMAKIGIYLESATILRFEDQRGPDGRKWQQSERARRDGGKTLVDTSQLRSSITHQSSARRAEVGTNKIYGGIHQYGMNESVSVSAHTRTVTSAFGKPLPGGLTYAVAGFERLMNMPARPFLGLSSEDEEEIGFLIEDHVSAAIGDNT